MGWKRPDSVPVPKVWYRFQARDVANGDQLVQYRVEDLTEDRYEDAIRHFTENFLEDEPLAAQRGLINDPVGLEEQYEFWRWVFDQKMTIVCYKQDSNEIVGANLLLVRTIADGKFDRELASDSLRDIAEIHGYMSSRFNVFEHYHVERYLSAVGLAINRNYRGLGIATQLLNARRSICRTFSIPLTTTDFTSQGAQAAASRAGFETNLEITYDEFSQIQPNFAYPGVKSKCMKMMSLLVDLE